MRVALYVLTLFGSAALLFAVQPLVGKALLPQLGGVPSAWTACLLFFQAALLVGYGYVWALGRVKVQLGAVIHAAVLIAALALGPLGALDVELGVSPVERPATFALMYLSLNLGPAFVALSATAPLLSLWFGVVEGRRPYFLYAASNAGSLLALIAYPFLIEPWLDVPSQALAFRIGMGVVALGILVAAVGVWRSPGTSSSKSTGTNTSTSSRLRWLVLSFVPALLLAGSSAVLSLDVAPVPLLWVIPLAIYIGSFVLAFAGDLFEPPPWLGRALCLVAVVLIYVSLTHSNEPLILLLVLHLFFLGGASWLAHRQLAESAPELERLPEFYALVALGGVLGTGVAALLAPAILPDLYEYPLAIAFACALRPLGGVVVKDRAFGRDLVQAASVAGLVALCAVIAPYVIGAVGAGLPRDAQRVAEAAVTLSPAALWSYRWMPLRRRYTMCLLALLVSAAVLSPDGDRVTSRRSFFGVVRVLDVDGSRALLHGTTLHGEQRIDERDDCVPRPYYVTDGPAGRIFDAHRARGREGRTVVVGLGTGALACYARRGEPWTYYEIDPTVAQIARDPLLFTYLRNSPSDDVEVTLADGRLGVASEQDASLALIVIDAFSSDSVPAHLLTVEALSLYLDKLRPGGWVVLHLSNRALDLPSVVANGAARLGLASRFVAGPSANYVVLARSETDLEGLSASARMPEGDASRAWTDRFSSLLEAIRYAD